MDNTYRIYIKSNKHPRTINTPRNARTYYDCIEIEGKENFIAKLNELVRAGEFVYEVRQGYWGKNVNFYKYLKK